MLSYEYGIVEGYQVVVWDGEYVDQVEGCLDVEGHE